MKIILLAFSIVLSTAVFGQTNDNTWTLEKVNTELATVERDLNRMEDRLDIIETREDWTEERRSKAGVYVNSRKEELQTKKEHLLRVKYSIENNPGKGNEGPYGPRRQVKRSELERLPKERQEKILNLPEKYEIIEG